MSTKKPKLTDKQKLYALRKEAKRLKDERQQADAKYAGLMKVGESAYASIAEMVAALECDYDRLEKLRDSIDLPAGYELDAVVAGYVWKNSELDKGSDRFDTEEEATLAAWEHANEDEAKELAELEKAAGGCESREDAELRIQEDALSVEVRSDWHEPTSGAYRAPSEFQILLSTGGPAVRIMGELNERGEPVRAWLEVQDWFQPWTQYLDADSDVLLAYARCFYFWEG